MRWNKEQLENPKLKGSNIIDCIPIPGRCPNNCKPCYYNDGDFFHDINEPIIPALEDVGDKIVRVNSGGDSSINMEGVLKLTERYPKKFYNTSLPYHIKEFPAPVVFTCNPRQDDGWFYAVSSPANIMAVRVRVTTWNLYTVDRIVPFYCNSGVPIILTFLYFNECDEGLIQHPYKYDLHKHIESNRYMIKWIERDRIIHRYPFYNVMTCGSYESHLCKDCGNCEKLYKRAVSLYYKEEV